MPGPAPSRDTKTTFEALGDDARIWVYAAPRAFTPEERKQLVAVMDKVLEKWVMKQAEIRGCYELVEDRFLFVGSDETRIGMDGCSVDAMMSFIMRLERETGLKLVDRMTMHYRASDGAVASLRRHEFAEKVASGEIGANTPVFDTAISRMESWRGGQFELPFHESWHAQAFPSS